MSQLVGLGSRNLERLLFHEKRDLLKDGVKVGQDVVDAKLKQCERQRTNTGPTPRANARYVFALSSKSTKTFSTVFL